MCSCSRRRNAARAAAHGSVAEIANGTPTGKAVSVQKTENVSDLTSPWSSSVAVQSQAGTGPGRVVCRARAARGRPSRLPAPADRAAAGRARPLERRPTKGARSRSPAPHIGLARPLDRPVLVDRGLDHPLRVPLEGRPAAPAPPLANWTAPTTWSTPYPSASRLRAAFRSIRAGSTSPNPPSIDAWSAVDRCSTNRSIASAGDEGVVDAFASRRLGNSGGRPPPGPSRARPRRREQRTAAQPEPADSSGQSGYRARSRIATVWARLGSSGSRTTAMCSSPTRITRFAPNRSSRSRAWTASSPSSTR